MIRTIFSLPLCLATLLTPLLSQARAAESAPNFLFIAIDDLNDFCGYAAEEPGNFLQTIYPDPKVRAEVTKRLTPNLDRLASQSASFLRGYCTSALCGPSRTSLLTGIPPNQSGYYMHDRNFRLYDTLKDVVTLPQYLKANGYFTTGLGKIFHTPEGRPEGPVKDDWADAMNSWTVWTNHGSGCGGGTNSKYSPPDGGLMQFGPSSLRLEQAADYQSADFAATLLEKGTVTPDPDKRGKSEPAVTLPKDRPFFLACGLFRPHLPFHAPKPFFERFPTAEMTGLNRKELDAIIGEAKQLPSGAQRFSDYNNGKMKVVMEHARKIGGAEAEIAAWREMIQAYLGCVSFADACVGRMLDGLDKSPQKENTIVTLWSDHGFHLGSKYHVAKQALWEEANRVTFMIRDPRPSAKQVPGPRRQLVSLQDIYPTVCSLAGLAIPKHVQGDNIMSVIASPTAPEVHQELLMTYMEGNHCLRTPDYRFTLFKDGSSELYQITKDPGQHHNLAKNPEAAELVTKFTAGIKKLTAGEVRSSGTPAAKEGSPTDDSKKAERQARQQAERRAQKEEPASE